MEKVRPLIAESSTSESANIETVLADMKAGAVVIPDYQRDSDQWDTVTKSLLVESVINNLSIPAFFFEVEKTDDGEMNNVIDGQQRLTTLNEFFYEGLRLVDSESAPYISPDSVHYSGKTFGQLPPAYQQTFKRYRLTIIKLRDLGDMRLEVFRRINQGGTPLSPHDIRLAYYGEGSRSLAFIRLVGIYDRSRQSGKRFIKTAKDKYNIDYPWQLPQLETWRSLWDLKIISRGQTSSEMFLWSLVGAEYDKVDSLLQNKSALEKLKVRYNKTIDEALDACVAQLKWQDLEKESVPLFMSYATLRESFFPFFQDWIHHIFGINATSLSVTKHRLIGSMIGAAFRLGLSPGHMTKHQWTKFVEFLRKPTETELVSWPQSKGRWDGERGYRAQFQEAENVFKVLTNGK